MTFGKILESYIEKNNLTVSELSRRSGVTRTLIHAIINGKRRLVPENSGKLIHPRIFPPEDLTALYDCYLSSELTEQEVSFFHMMISGLRGEIADQIKNRAVAVAPIGALSNGAVLRGRENVLGAIAFAVNSGTERLISNFAFDEDVSALIYRAYADKKIASVCHTVRFGEEEPARKLRFLFMALAFAELGVKTKIDARSGGVWDHFLLTDKYFIQYDCVLSHALVLSPEQAPQDLPERYDNSRDLTVIFKDVFDSVISNEMEQPSAGQRDFYSVSDVVSECFVTQEGVLRSLSPDVPEKERRIIVQGLKNHYDIIFGPDFFKEKGANTLRCAIPDTDIVDFAEHGRIKEAPAWFFPNVPYDVRAEILKPFIERSNASISVINSEYFGPIKTNVEGNTLNLTLAGVSGGDINAPNAFKDIRVVCGDRAVIDMAMKTFQFFINSYYCMGKEESAIFIRQQLIKLEALSAPE